LKSDKQLLRYKINFGHKKLYDKGLCGLCNKILRSGKIILTVTNTLAYYGTNL